MITLRKLRTLKEGTRLRKYITILRDLEDDLKKNSSINSPYYKDLLREIAQETELPSRIKDLTVMELELYNINSIRHLIMSHLGMDPSEWDFVAPPDRKRSELKTGMNLYLDDIRSPFNMGSLFRSAECFAVNKLFLSKDSTLPTHNRAVRTAMGSIELMDWEHADINDLTLPVFALELGGTPIDEFDFPKEGIAIIGSEELGVSPEALRLAEQSLGRVTIPLYGSKSSLNVANATAILLQRWGEKILKG